MHLMTQHMQRSVGGLRMPLTGPPGGAAPHPGHHHHHPGHPLQPMFGNPGLNLGTVGKFILLLALLLWGWLHFEKEKLDENQNPFSEFALDLDSVSGNSSGNKRDRSFWSRMIFGPDSCSWTQCLILMMTCLLMFVSFSLLRTKWTTRTSCFILHPYDASPSSDQTCSILPNGWSGTSTTTQTSMASPEPDATNPRSNRIRTWNETSSRTC